MADVLNIRDALRAQPFEPFDLKTVDGTCFTIRHPDFLVIPPMPPRPRAIMVFTPGDVIPGSWRTHWVDLNLIVDVVIPSQAAAPGPRGAP